jgi:ketosteroid isomerase-like protein
MDIVELHKRNLDVVTTVAANGIRGRWDLVRPLVADDIVLRIPETLPWGGERRGWDGYQDALLIMGKFFSEFDVGPSSFDPFADKVLIQTEIRGRVATTGKAIRMPLLEVWQVRERKVCQIVAYFFDTKTLVEP